MGLPEVAVVADRFTPEDLEKSDIYPRIWRRDGDDARLWLADAYERLLRMYREAAGRGAGVVIWIA